METDAICRILEVGAKAGVHSLKFGTLEVVYRDNLTIAGADRLLGLTESTDLPNDFRYPPRDATGQTKPNVAFDSGLLDDLRLSQLMIDDPVSFEREIINAQTRQVYSDEENR